MTPLPDPSWRKPVGMLLILALIAGGAAGVTTNMILGGGLAFPAAPGSIIAVTFAARITHSSR